MSETIIDKYAGQTEITNPEHALNVATAKGFTLKPGEQTTIKTCIFTTRIRVTNSNKESGKFWFRAGVHPIEPHEDISGETSQVHDRLFGPFGAFVGNHGKVPLYFETSC